MSNGSDIFQQMAEKSPNYGALATASYGRKIKRKSMTAMASAGKVASAGIKGLSDTTTALNNAKAGLAQAEAEASATRQNGMMSAIGSIGGAAIGAIGSPKPSTTDYGSLGASNFDLNKNFW